MAFFGLTALGPQSIFQSNLLSIQNFTLFSEEEYRSAFAHASAGAEAVSAGLVPGILKEVFGGRPPAEEVAGICAELGEEPVTLAALLAAAGTVAETLKSKSQQNVSTGEFTYDLRRHARMEFSPADAYARPLTSSQQHGWEPVDPSSMGKRYPKKSSAETRYADAMVNAGEDPF